jgi:uncharacterized caspase-like protein
MKIGHEPGLQIEQLLKRVRLDVSNTTARQQFPWESSSLTVEFSFFPAGAHSRAADAASNSQPARAAKARRKTRSVEAWQKELKSKTAREAYEHRRARGPGRRLSGLPRALSVAVERPRSCAACPIGAR